MRRPENAAHRHWDEPFWQALRLLIDQRGFTTVEVDEVVPRLRALRAVSATSLADWLEAQPELDLIRDLAGYTHTRWELGQYVHRELLRTEDVAKADFATVSSDAVRQYGTQAAHHQSSKVMVQTVETIANAETIALGITELPDTNPQKRAALIGKYIWVSPRRLDGALPSLANPVGPWEIKEYWGVTSGGSKMSDAVYELQLVGTELQLQESKSGHHVEHIAIIDGWHQWSARMSDLRRIIDLLYCGLLDEVIFGSEVLTDWGPAVRRMWERVL